MPANIVGLSTNGRPNQYPRNNDSYFVLFGENALNLMIGTDPTARGGIASVVTVIIKDDFFRTHEVRYVVSHTDGGAITKLILVCTSFFCVLGICAFSAPRIVHVHSASRSSFYRKSLFLAVARIFMRKTILHVHGGEFQQFCNDESGLLMRWWIRHTLVNSSRVLALSDSWAEFIRTYAPGANVLVLPNSVQLRDPPALSIDERYRILFLGRVGRRKGVFELLTAVAMLKLEFPMIKLVLGGDGDLTAIESAIRTLDIGHHVELLGWVGPDQKAAELMRASIFTLPSHDEGLPMAMLEAMAAGKAIVVTSVGGIPQAVTDGENGLLTPPNDAIRLAASFKRLFADDSLRKKLAANARATIAERFSTEIVMAKLSDIYTALGSQR